MRSGDVMRNGDLTVEILSTEVDSMTGEIPVWVMRDGKRLLSSAKPDTLRAAPSTATVTIDGKSVTVEKPVDGEKVTKAIWPD